MNTKYLSGPADQENFASSENVGNSYGDKFFKKVLEIKKNWTHKYNSSTFYILEY